MKGDADGEVSGSMPKQTWLSCKLSQTWAEQDHCIVMPWVPICKWLILTEFVFHPLLLTAHVEFSNNPMTVQTEMHLAFK